MTCRKHNCDWLTCTLCRSGRQSLSTLERAARRSIDWPSHIEQPPIFQEVLSIWCLNWVFVVYCIYWPCHSQRGASQRFEFMPIIKFNKVSIYVHWKREEIISSMQYVRPLLFNPFVPNAPFLYPLKTSENCKVFWCFQGVKKRSIGNKWVNTFFSVICHTTN